MCYEVFLLRILLLTKTQRRLILDRIESFVRDNAGSAAFNKKNSNRRRFAVYFAR